MCCRRRWCWWLLLFIITPSGLRLCPAAVGGPASVTPTIDSRSTRGCYHLPRPEPGGPNEVLWIYIPLSARHGGSHPDAQVGKVDLAPRGHRRQLAILTALREKPALAPDSQRDAMPAACSRHRPAALCPESVVTQYAPLLICALVRLTSCAGHRRPGRENGRVLRTCSQTLPTIFPTPARPDLLAHAAALLPRHAFVH